MRLTGTLAKFRAKLTELTLPGSSVEASAVKNRNVSGSIGWLTILGTMSRHELADPAGPQVEPRPAAGTTSA